MPFPIIFHRFLDDLQLNIQSTIKRNPDQNWLKGLLRGDLSVQNSNSIYTKYAALPGPQKVGTTGTGQTTFGWEK